MTFEQVVSSRFSVRRYLDKPVADEQVMQLLAWAHRAPSGGNTCPWEFILLRSAEMKRAVTDCTYQGNNETGDAHQDWIATAPVVIAVCANLDRIRARYGATSMWQNLIYLDCSAAIENMLLGAVALGLGACYISGFHEAPLASALELPENVLPVALIPVGYADQPETHRPRMELNTLIFEEKYGLKRPEAER